MPSTHFGPSSDLPTWAVVVACVLVAASSLLLVVELRRRQRGGLLIVATGVVSLVALLAAVLRPVRIAARESVIGPRVIVLADTSRSMALRSDDDTPRWKVRDDAIRQLVRSAEHARFVTLGFGEGRPHPLAVDEASSPERSARAPRSDLATALRAVATAPDERPSAIVVVSDGRLDDPPDDEQAVRALGASLGIPVHAVATTRDAPPDAAIRRVAAAGAAVAHVPLPLRVEVGCAGGLACGELTVSARELREGGAPAVLASGIAHIKDGKGVVDLTIVLERAGLRIVEVSVASPEGDTIPENDRRLVTFNVARERVRVLHVAGRPTHDVRALRQWLKGDASVDVVAFFILRTPSDNPNALQDDLALIPFPVDELFSEHLPSFDAVVLQDFDAQPYGLERHLPALARYVKSGGGLIMVGGPNSFVAGGYAGTPLAEVLPVTLDGSHGATGADTGSFVPQWTDIGRVAPMLAPLRAVVGDELPTMPGANVLGNVRPGAIALWTHPTRKAPDGTNMPVLAVGDEGDGRAIALGVDGGWLFQFSALGARTGGRGHGALWDGLLGWLMRDPRFEPAQIEMPGGCVAGLPSTLRVSLPPNGSPGEPIVLEVVALDRDHRVRAHIERARPEGRGGGQPEVLELELPPLAPGGYVSRLRVGKGVTTRRDFACEAGGDEWADSRPDGGRLEALARSTKGSFVWARDGVTKIPLPKPTVVSSERHVVPLAPPWLWSLVAAVALGVHWIARRRSGLA